VPVEVGPNFIRIRVANPKQFIRFRIKDLGKGIKAVIGFKKGGGSQIQSLLFPKSRYTLSKARSWVKSHGYTVEETWLIYDIMVGIDYIEFNETLLTPEEEAKLPPEIDVKEMKKEVWKWLLE